MAAIDNIRRDLANASWLQYSAAPFAGAVHNFDIPMRKRLASRHSVGPYYWTPTTPGKGRAFYQAVNGLDCDRHGSTFHLRLEYANDVLPSHARLRHTTGYYIDGNQDDTIAPIVARLPHGRGFLAGWTMGRGMLASLAPDIHDTIEEAARAAHSEAESDADKMRDDAEQQAALDRVNDAMAEG